MSFLNILNALKGSPMTKYYRSRNGAALFKFAFAPENGHIAVSCLEHPSLNGRDADVSKTHLFSSGRICFVAGREPRTQARAEQLAQQWAEYFLEYRRTGIPQH